MFWVKTWSSQPSRCIRWCIDRQQYRLSLSNRLDNESQKLNIFMFINNLGDASLSKLFITWNSYLPTRSQHFFVKTWFLPFGKRCVLRFRGPNLSALGSSTTCRGFLGCRFALNVWCPSRRSVRPSRMGLVLFIIRIGWYSILHLGILTWMSSV